MNVIPFSAGEIEEYRRETQGVKHVVHLNNAGASLMPDPVVRSLESYLSTETRYGGYETAAIFKDDIDQAYFSIAALIGAHPDEIALTSSATDSWLKVFSSFNWKPGDEILTSKVEYGSNFISFLQAKKAFGIHIVVAPSLPAGEVDVEKFEQFITPRTRLIALTHMPTHSGLVNPAQEIGAIARAHGIPYLLDACQTVGQLPVNVEEIQCDFLSATGRKFLRGPRGTGFLYVKSEWIPKLEPFGMDMLGADWPAPDRYVPEPSARRFEHFEQFVAGKRALGEAARYALKAGPDRIWNRICMLRDDLKQKLETLPGLTVWDQGQRPGGILVFNVNGVPSPDLLHALRMRGVNVSVTRSAGALLDIQERGMPECVRASVHYYNTPEENDRLVQLIRPLIRY
jgi:selenocysteine lyase/cysteine desulfurase